MTKVIWGMDYGRGFWREYAGSEFFEAQSVRILDILSLSSKVPL